MNRLYIHLRTHSYAHDYEHENWSMQRNPCLFCFHTRCAVRIAWRSEWYAMVWRGVEERIRRICECEASKHNNTEKASSQPEATESRMGADLHTLRVCQNRRTEVPRTLARAPKRPLALGAALCCAEEDEKNLHCLALLYDRGSGCGTSLVGVFFC